MVIERLNESPALSLLPSHRESCFPFMKRKQESSLRNSFSLSREDLVHRDEREFFTTGKTVVQFTAILSFSFFYFEARTHSFRPVSREGREGNKIFREDRTRMIRFGKTGGKKSFPSSRRNRMFFFSSPLFRGATTVHTIFVNRRAAH